MNQKRKIQSYSNLDYVAYDISSHIDSEILRKLLEESHQFTPKEIDDKVINFKKKLFDEFKKNTGEI